MPLPTPLSFLGVARETVRGTAVVPAKFIPVRSPDWMDDVKYLEDKGLRGSMSDTYDMIQGVKHAEFGWDGDAYADTFGWILRTFLGDLTTTGAGPFTHAFSLLNSIASNGQPDSLTVTDFYGQTGGSGGRAFAAWLGSDLTVRFNADGMLEYSVKGLSIAGAAAATPVPSFSTITATPAWTGVSTIDAVATNLLESCELTIARPVTPIFNVDGTQAPYRIWAGPMKVSGKATMLYETDAQLDDYRVSPQTKRALDFLFTMPGSPTRSLKFHMTSVQYVSPTKITRGKDYVQQEITFEALANTTDVGSTAGFAPLKCTLVNAEANYT